MKRTYIANMGEYENHLPVVHGTTIVGFPVNMAIFYAHYVQLLFEHNQHIERVGPHMGIEHILSY